MGESILKFISKIAELSSNVERKAQAKKLVTLLAASLTFSSCDHYEKRFDYTYDKESALIDLLSDYEKTKKSNGATASFEKADYSQDIQLGNTIAQNLIEFIRKDSRGDRTLYIVDLPGHLNLIINKELKKNNVNTTLDVNIDYADDKKVNDIDYSKFFGVLAQIGGEGANDEHIIDKKEDGTIIAKPYAILFDYNRINEGLNDLENEKTFHNQYTIEEDIPGKEMFKGEDAIREKVIAFTFKKMNQDLAGGLMELSKTGDVPVQVIIIDENGSILDSEIPADLKTTWQDTPPKSNNTVHSHGMPFWYWYYITSNHTRYNNSTGHVYGNSEHYSSGFKESSFKSNGTITKTTPAHFQKSSPIRSSAKFSGGSSIRSS